MLQLLKELQRMYCSDGVGTWVEKVTVLKCTQAQTKTFYLFPLGVAEIEHYNSLAVFQLYRRRTHVHKH